FELLALHRVGLARQRGTLAELRLRNVIDHLRERARLGRGPGLEAVVGLGHLLGGLREVVLEAGVAALQARGDADLLPLLHAALCDECRRAQAACRDDGKQTRHGRLLLKTGAYCTTSDRLS